MGLTVKHYRYYNEATKRLDWDNLIADLSQAEAGDVVLFHGCCHNPTGIDPTPAQWDELAKMSAEKGWFTALRLCLSRLCEWLRGRHLRIACFRKKSPRIISRKLFIRKTLVYTTNV